jgi:Flp pilus assembly protein TadD
VNWRSTSSAGRHHVDPPQVRLVADSDYRERPATRLMYKITSRLSKTDADDLADAIASFTMGTANPAVKKVRRLAEIEPDDESDAFEIE